MEKFYPCLAKVCLLLGLSMTALTLLSLVVVVVSAVPGCYQDYFEEAAGIAFILSVPLSTSAVSLLVASRTLKYWEQLTGYFVQKENKKTP